MNIDPHREPTHGPSSHTSPARYWFGGLVLLLVFGILAWLLLANGDSKICDKKTETSLCLALALGIGFSFIGGTAKVDGKATWIGLPAAISLSGGIAGVALGLFGVNYVIGKNCKPPVSIPCSDYGADGTCIRCTDDGSFSAREPRVEIKTLSCNGMKKDATINVSFHGYVTVDGHESNERKLVSVALFDSLTRKEISRAGRRDVAYQIITVQKDMKANSEGKVSIYSFMPECLWQIGESPVDSTCSAAGTLEIRANP